MTDNIGLENLNRFALNMWRISDGYVTEQMVQEAVNKKLSITLTGAQLAEAVRGPEYFTQVVGEAADIIVKEPDLFEDNFEPEEKIDDVIEVEDLYTVHMTVMEGGESLTLSYGAPDTSVSAIRKSVDKIFERFDSIEPTAVITIVIEEL